MIVQKLEETIEKKYPFLDYLLAFKKVFFSTRKNYHGNLNYKVLQREKCDSAFTLE